MRVLQTSLNDVSRWLAAEHDVFQTWPGFINFSDGIFALEHGRIIEIGRSKAAEDGEDAPPWLKAFLDAPRLTKLCGTAAVVFGIGCQGELLVFHADAWRQVLLARRQREACSHGVPFDDEGEILVKEVSSTLETAFVVDSTGSLLSFPLTDLTSSSSSDAEIFVTPIRLPRRVLGVRCGRAHVIVLCEPGPTTTITANLDSLSAADLLSRETATPTSVAENGKEHHGHGSPGTNPNCVECTEDAGCRLSLLMRLADVEAKKSNFSQVVPSTPPPTAVDSATPKSRFGLGRFKLRFSRRVSKENKSRSVFYSSRKDVPDDGVEMSSISPLTRTQPGPAQPGATITDLAGSASFAYVSLDNALDLDESSLSTTPDTQPTVDSDLDSPLKVAKPVPPPRKLRPTFEHDDEPCDGISSVCELWSFGENQYGQLGHSDTVARREPRQIRNVAGAIVRVCVGDDHNVVLTACGTAFVWGSNIRGQLRTTTQAFIETPIRWKFGAESCVIDVAASGCQTSAIVVGQSRKSDAGAMAFVFGRSDVTEGSPVVLPLGSGQGLPCRIHLSGKDIVLVGMAPSTSVSVHSDLHQLTKAARFASDLSQVLRQTTGFRCDDAAKLLESFTSAIQAWSELLSRTATRSLTAFCDYGFPRLWDTLPTRAARKAFFKEVIKAVLRLHFAYIELSAFRSAVATSEGSGAGLDQLCLEHGVEGRTSRLAKLCRLCFTHFFAVRSIMFPDQDDATPSGFWRHLEQTVARNEKYATLTTSLNSILAIRKPGRIVIWSSATTKEQVPGETLTIRLKEPSSTLLTASAVITAPWNRLMGNMPFTTVVVCSDAVILLHKSSQLVFDMPLVWVTSGSTSALNSEEEDGKSSEVSVQIISPEYEFHVEFSAVEIKNDFLCGFAAVFRYRREYSDLVVVDEHHASTVHGLPRVRYGSYEYSAAHPVYRNARYEGFWKNGLPHGLGKMVFEDGRQYKGHFAAGRIQGYGEMRVPDSTPPPTPYMSSVFFVSPPSSTLSQAVHVFRGKFRDGKLHGLGFIAYADGETYEGYCANNLPDGHGVNRRFDSADGHCVYVGAWRGGKRNGYGVLSMNKERYLGMWRDDEKQGNGCHITIDGVFHEGVFDKNRLTTGRMVCQMPLEGTASAMSPTMYDRIYTGGFDDIGRAADAGVLYLTPSDRIEGSFTGNIVNGNFKINDGTYTRIQAATNDSREFIGRIVEEKPTKSPWSVPADLKWQEIFDHFLTDELGLSQTETGLEQCQRAWDRLASALEKLKKAKGVQVSEKLERVPDVAVAWSQEYYATVADFWGLFMVTPHHPVHRLVTGLVEIFCGSYNNIGTHAIMYDSAVLEFMSLIERTYDVFRHLFPSLPSTHDMYRPVPGAVILPEDPLQNSSTDGEDQTSLESQSISSRSRTTSSLEEMTVPQPACDFVLEYYFCYCYAEIFTMYSVKCADTDKRYWEQVRYLNSRTDAELLDYFGVEKCIWPTDPDNADTGVDPLIVRITARQKFYKSAIHTLQRLSGEFKPSAKLAILVETLSEITACVSQFSSAGKSHIWSGDDLLPAFMYVVVRAQLQHLGAEIRLINDFCTQLSGPGDLMFTLLCASYVHICKEKSVP